MRLRCGGIPTLMVLLIVILTAGCASTPAQAPGELANRDPLENYNRRMYAFNDALDRAFIKPLARGYQLITPSIVDRGVSNFFANIDDITVAVNDLLQAKFAQAATDTGRFLINTTLGIGGLFDVASSLGLEKHDEDFGQTLGYWGVPSGPYLILPLLGPSTLRDAPTLVAARYTTPWPYLDLATIEQRGIDLLAAVDLRADLMGAEKVVNQMALDRYATIRDSFLDRRLNKVYDGNPPLSEQSFDPIKELEMLEELESLDASQ